MNLDILDIAGKLTYAEGVAIDAILKGAPNIAVGVLQEHVIGLPEQAPEPPAQETLFDLDPHPPVASEPAPEPIEEPPVSATPGFQTDMFGSATPRPPAKLSGVASRIRGRK